MTELLSKIEGGTFAGSIRVKDASGAERTIFETWHRIRTGLLGRLGLVSERRLNLSTGEAVEQSALTEDLFVVIDTLEPLVRMQLQRPRGDRARPAQDNFAAVEAPGRLPV